MLGTYLLTESLGSERVIEVKRNTVQIISIHPDKSDFDLLRKKQGLKLVLLQKPNPNLEHGLLPKP